MTHRRRSLRTPLALVALGAPLLLLPLVAPLAAVPGEINFQGLLLDSSGDVVNGSVDLDFEIFDAASAGTSLWSESQTGVSVFDGVYDVALGSVTPIDTSVLSGGSVWLEISVDGETLAPRQRLLAVPYALRAEHAESADVAGNLPPGAIDAIYAQFAFDGADPPNDDPSEGLGDTDSDGVANFIDTDNDDDGIPDGIEVAQGSDINLKTPTYSGTVPAFAFDAGITPVIVQGTGFVPGITIQVGAQNPTPNNITDTSFDIVLNPQPASFPAVTITRPNGQQATGTFEFRATPVTYSGTVPPIASDVVPTALQVQGTGFVPGITVQVGAQMPTPTNITGTTFDITVNPETASVKPVTITRPNLQQATGNLQFALTDPFITQVLPGVARTEPTTFTVTGTDFIGTLTVTFDGIPVTPANVTPTSFSFDHTPATQGTKTVLLVLSNGQSDSDTVVVDNSLRVFATSTTQTGAFGGLAGADAICAARASAAGLSGTYLAWLGDATGSPSTRFTQSGPYRRVSGDVIADDWADLTDGTLDRTISTDEFGVGVPSSFPWTNVSTDGTTSDTNDCSSWTSASGSGRYGATFTTTGTWTFVNFQSCATPARLFCFEQ